MIEAPAESSTLFDLPHIERADVEEYADRAYSSARARERFEQQFNTYQESGGDPLRLGIGCLILGRFAAALEALQKAEETGLSCYYAGHAALGLDKLTEAVDFFKQASRKGWNTFECDMRCAAIHLRLADEAAARKLVKKHESTGADKADWHYVNGLLADLSYARAEAIECYERALAIDPDHVEASFRCAHIYDLTGDDAKAIELYQRLALQPRAHVNALINLAVLYEDRDCYGPAEQCLQRVLAAHPNHARARLFLRDVLSGAAMVIDDSVEQSAASRERLLSTPINEFELSVRARNCLKKMKIHSLGDLLNLSEIELLAFKNFGETSLNEIKALLTKRGLRLGQPADEIDPAAVAQAAAVPKVVIPPGREAMVTKPVSELELSVRARRCLQRLNVVTIGELLQRSESELLSARNFGLTSLNEIKARLHDLGLSLAGKP